MNIKPKREGDKIQKILERFDKRFFNPSIPSPTELKSFIQKELSSLIREERKEMINLIRSLDELKETKSLFGKVYSYFMDGCIAVKKQMIDEIENLEKK